MKFFTAALSLAAAACAAPTSTRSYTGEFGIIALRSASPIHFATLSATGNSLRLNLPQDKVDSQCVDGETHVPATLYIEDEELYLYGPEDKPKQIVYLDRSGMGQGVIQYTTKTDDPLGGRLETKGWRVDEVGNLFFKDNGLLACPLEADQGYVVRLDVGISNPHGYKDCLGFTARTVSLEEPVPCWYSSH